MPSYSYRCGECEWEGTLYGVAISERDFQTCPRPLHDMDCDMDEDCTCTPKPCGFPLEREEIPETQARSDYRFQTKAIMSDGRKVSGHFGKEASINKGGRWSR